MEDGQRIKERLLSSPRRARPFSCIPCLWDAVYVPDDDSKLVCSCKTCFSVACTNPLPESAPSPCSPAWVDLRLFLYLLYGEKDEHGGQDA